MARRPLKRSTRTGNDYDDFIRDHSGPEGAAVALILRMDDRAEGLDQDTAFLKYLLSHDEVDDTRRTGLEERLKRLEEKSCRDDAHSNR